MEQCFILWGGKCVDEDIDLNRNCKNPSIPHWWVSASPLFGRSFTILETQWECVVTCTD
jgi:hypothetical protein